MKVLDRLEMLQSLNDKQEQTITILRKQVDESQKICDLYKSKLETQEKNFQKVENKCSILEREKQSFLKS